MCILALFSKLSVVCLVLSGPKGTSFFNCSKYSRSLARLQTHKHRVSQQTSTSRKVRRHLHKQTDKSSAHPHVPERQKQILFLLCCDCHVLLLTQWGWRLNTTWSGVGVLQVWFQVWLWVWLWDVACSKEGWGGAAGLAGYTCYKLALSNPCEESHPRPENSSCKGIYQYCETPANINFIILIISEFTINK